jgi:prevent-host-death family protein
MAKKSECSIMQLRREGGNVIARVKIAGDRVVVTDYGKPQAAIVTLEDLAALEAGSFAKYDPSEAISIKAENRGSNFDDFLREEGIYHEVKEKSRKKIADWLKSQKNIKPKKR